MTLANKASQAGVVCAGETGALVNAGVISRPRTRTCKARLYENGYKTRESRSVRHRPGGLLAAVQRPEAQAGRLPAQWSTADLDKFCEVVDAGLVDSAPGAAAAGDLFVREGVELVICYVGTYATSSQVLPAVQQAGAPVLILNLQPVSALDYPKTDTGEWLANCCSCCVPEIACAFARSRIDFHVVTGVLGVEGGRFREAPPVHPDSQRAWQEIEAWVRAASGRQPAQAQPHRFPGPHLSRACWTCIATSPSTPPNWARTSKCWSSATWRSGCPRRPSAPWQPNARRPQRIFDISQDSPSDPLARAPKPEQMEWACRVAVALDRLVADFDLHGLAYYYRGLDGNEYERLGAGLILGCSLLTARGIPGQRRRRSQELPGDEDPRPAGVGGSYTEFYAMDFDEDFLLMGHDGPFHLGIAEGKPILRGLGLYHGKRGYGVSVEARVKLGPVTLLAITQTADGKLKLLASEGESVPGAMLQIGNTNSRIRFHTA